MATKKAKRFDVGGQVGNAGSNTYPFTSGAPAAPAASTTVNVGGATQQPLQAAAPFTNEAVRTMKSGGKVSSASSRADGIASKGKTKGRMV